MMFMIMIEHIPAIMQEQLLHPVQILVMFGNLKQDVITQHMMHGALIIVQSTVMAEKLFMMQKFMKEDVEIMNVIMILLKQKQKQ